MSLPVESMQDDVARRTRLSSRLLRSESSPSTRERSDLEEPIVVNIARIASPSRKLGGVSWTDGVVVARRYNDVRVGSRATGRGKAATSGEKAR